MPRVTKRGAPPETQPDVLEVIHNEIPETAAGAGANPIPAQRAVTAGAATTAAASTEATAQAKTTPGTGMTWRSMLRACAIAEVAALAIMLTAATLYGMEFFAPLAIAAVLHAGAVVWLPRMTKAGAVYSLVIMSLTFLMFGGMFFGWTGFLYPTSWFEMAFATFTVTVPLGGIVAGIATLRHKDGDNAAKTPSRVVAALATVVVVIGLIGSATASNATRLPGDHSLTASNFEFEQTAITAKAGDVPIYFQNDDPFAHNVEIKGKGASKDAAGRTAIRHVFKGMTPGTYSYFCAIHPDMKGTLTVT
ncbi:MAG TPA: cupredoxin domain-containing protein [Frankiaceae bacterium]|nr:cupredoxin domain-containing protein [Frankiaceae bacterium]